MGLAELFDGAPFGVIVIDADGCVRYVNRKQCDNSLLPAEFFLGKPYRETFYHSLDRAGLLAHYDRLVADGTPFEVTLLDYKRHSDDANLAFSLRGYQSATDIVLVSTIDKVLATQRSRYEQLFENANDGIFVLSREGRFVAANRKFAEITGVPLEKMIGETTEIFLPGRFKQSLERLERILREGRLGPYELEIETPLGRKFISLNGVALLEEGRAVGVINIARDTTQEHRQADALREARDQALEASRLKSSFLANMSHEIRTPLNVILGLTSIISDHLIEVGDPTQDEHFESIQRASQRLLQTIHGILDFSRIETGAFEVRPTQVDVAVLVRRQLGEFTPLAEKKGITLKAAIDVDEGGNTFFDEHCLCQVLTNLLDNAIKFTLKGGIDVRLWREQHGSLLLEVTDTGVGIDEAFLPHLFEPFSQEEGGYTRPFEGSGLGLALVKKYLEMNSASIEVKSKKGEGSQFRIRFATNGESNRAIPCTEKPVSSAPAGVGPVDSTARKPMVLVVEDDFDTQRFMSTLLRKSYDVLLAANEAECHAQLAAHGREVRVLLMDLSLHGSADGLSLVSAIRAEQRWRTLPIIAVTAHAFPKDRERALEAGCDEYLSKPFGPRELLAKISKLLSLHGS